MKQVYLIPMSRYEDENEKVQEIVEIKEIESWMVGKTYEEKWKKRTPWGTPKCDNTDDAKTQYSPAGRKSRWDPRERIS